MPSTPRTLLARAGLHVLAMPSHHLTIDEAFALADILHVPASVIFPTANHIGADAHAPTPIV